MKIPVNYEVLSAYANTVKDKSTYLGFMIRNQKLCIYSELNEITYVSICDARGSEDLSIRLPVETMNALMLYGYIEIIDKERSTGASKIISSYTDTGRLRCTVEIASEFADNEEQIKDFISAITNESYKEIKGVESFNNALSLATIKSKDVGIKGVNFNKGKCFTMGNGFAAYRNDPTDLSLILPTSTLRELVRFCKGKSILRLYQHNGYNLIFDGRSILAWRRTRASQFMEVPNTDYDVNIQLPVDNITRVFRCIKTEVSRCVINYKTGFIEINSQVGNYEIPLEYINESASNIKINYGIFSEILSKVKEPVRLESNKNNIHILSSDGTHYYIGVSYD